MPFVVAVTVLVGIAFFLPESRTDYSTWPGPAWTHVLPSVTPEVESW